MSLSLKMVQTVKALLLSDHMTIGGHEYESFNQIIGALDIEERLLSAVSQRERVRSVPSPARSDPIPPGTEGASSAPTGN